MNESNFFIENHQGWRFSGSIKDDDYQADCLKNLRKPAKRDLLYEVKFIWSQHHSKELTAGQKLSRELKKADNDTSRNTRFAVCKRTTDTEKCTYVVFGNKTEQRQESCRAGIMLSVWGLGLAAGGIGLPATIVLAFGSGMFFDAYKKDEYDYNDYENVKQGFIGATVGVLSAGLGTLFNVGKSAHVATQILSSSATNVVCHAAGEKFNSRPLTAKGIVLSGTIGLISATASKAATSALPALVAVDQADDILLKAFTEGAVSAGTGQMINNRINNNPVTSNLLESSLFGGVTAAAFALPKYHEAKEAQLYAKKQDPNKGDETPITEAKQNRDGTETEEKPPVIDGTEKDETKNDGTETEEKPSVIDGTEKDETKNDGTETEEKPSVIDETKNDGTEGDETKKPLEEDRLKTPLTPPDATKRTEWHLESVLRNFMGFGTKIYEKIGSIKYTWKLTKFSDLQHWWNFVLKQVAAGHTVEMKDCHGNHAFFSPDKSIRMITDLLSRGYEYYDNTTHEWINFVNLKSTTDLGLISEAANQIWNNLNNDSEYGYQYFRKGEHKKGLGKYTEYTLM